MLEKRNTKLSRALITKLLIIMSNTLLGNTCLNQQELNNLCAEFVKQCKSNPTICMLSDSQGEVTGSITEPYSFLEPGIYSIYLKTTFLNNNNTIFVINSSSEHCISGYQYNTKITRSLYTKSNKIEIRYCNKENKLLNKISDICIDNDSIINCEANETLTCKNINNYKCN